MKTAKTIAVSLLLLPGLAGAAFAQSASPAQTADARTAPAPAPVGTAGATNTDYRLVAGDKLRIEVYKDPQLSQALQIRPDGKVTLPLVGDVLAAGRTSIELRDAISEALKEYIANPVVTAPIIGPRTLEQFTGSLRSVDITLDADALARLDKIFPGPGGPAPEAYAW